MGRSAPSGLTLELATSLLRLLLKLCRLFSRSSRFVEQALFAGLLEIGVRRSLLLRGPFRDAFLGLRQRTRFRCRPRAGLPKLVDGDRQLFKCRG